MPFQPIQFQPLGNPVAEGVNQLVAARKNMRAEELARAQHLLQKQNIEADNLRADEEMKLQKEQFKRTGDNQEEAKVRQGAEDFQKIYEASGRDPNMARQMAQAYGYEIVDSPAGPVAVKTQQPVPNPQAPAPVPSNAGAVSPPPQPNPSVGGGGQFMAGPPELQPGQAAPVGSAAPPPPQPTESQLTAVENKANPILAAFRMKNKRGQEFQVDPAAARAAEEEKLAQDIKLRAAAPEVRAAKAAEEAQKRRDFTAAENEKYRSEGLTFDQKKELANIAGGYRVKAATAATESPLKVDAANRQDIRTLSSDFKNFVNEHQLLIDSKTNKRLETAAANLGSGNAMQQREAAESLVSIFKGGGQVTKASQDLLLKHLAGIVGDAQTFIQHMSTGHYGEQELGVLKQAADNALVEQNERMAKAQQDAVTTFGPGTGYEAMGGNVNHKVRGFFGQFGLQTPDLYPEEQAQTAVLGSGKRPSKNPIVKAAKASKLSPEDRAAVDWAKANPNDPQAKEILRVNGL